MPPLTGTRGGCRSCSAALRGAGPAPRCIRSPARRRLGRAPPVFALVQASLGLQFDPDAREIRFEHPMLPEFLDHLHVRGLRLGDAEADVLLHRSGQEVRRDSHPALRQRAHRHCALEISQCPSCSCRELQRRAASGQTLPSDGRSANDRFRAVSGSPLARSCPSAQRRERSFLGRWPR